MVPPTLFRMASLYVALFLSGSAALVYQSTWGRMLQRVFGVSDHAIATVLATFFLGLGLGSALGGRLGNRSKGPARLYAILEIFIGVWAMASLMLIPRVHDVYAAIGAGMSFGGLTAIRLLLAVFVLLPPTLLMGATLPVLIQAVAKRGMDWSSSATALYATNTLGAVFGAGITGLYLVPTFGAKLSIVVAAAASFSAALIVFAVWRAPTKERARPAPTPEPESEAGPDDDTIVEEEREDPALAETEVDTRPPEQRAPAKVAAATPKAPPAPRKVTEQLGLAMGLASIAGFAALASEVLWTRVLRLVVQGTTQAFAAMLVNYLLGIAIGSVVANRIMQRPGRSATFVFGVSQLLLVLLTALALLVGAQMPRLLVLIQGSTNIVPHEAWVVLAASSILLFPLALVLGTSVPLAWKIAGGTPEQAAKYSGRVLATNTIGGLLGSFCAGFLLVPWRGVEASIIVVMLVHAIAASLALGAHALTHRFERRGIAEALIRFEKRFGSGDERAAISVVGLIRLVVAIITPLLTAVLILRAQPTLNVPFLLDAWYDGSRAVIEGPDESYRLKPPDGNLVFLKEGRNTTVTILDRESSLRLFNDGRPESGFGTSEPGFGEELSTLGTLPTLFAEEHERAMVIGLGAGHTTAVLLGGPWQQLDVVELEGAIVDAARRLYTEREKAFPLDDERANLIVDDARAQLVLAKPETYDAIVSQPSHPWLAGSSALYTVEFFQEAKRALKPGGVLALWSNLFRMDVEHLKSITRTLLEVFDHVKVFVVETSSFIFIAGNEPLPLDAQVGERLRLEGLRPYLQPFALDDVIDFAGTMELDTIGATEWSRGAELIIDDRPSLEFDLARIPHFDSISEQQLDRALLPVPWMSAASLTDIAPELRAAVIVQRIDYTHHRMAAMERVWDALEQIRQEQPDLLTAADNAIINGVYAEQHGDTRAALRAYAQSPDDPTSVYRRDLLLSNERMYEHLIRVAREREALPASARPFLSASLAIRRDEAMRIALDLSDRIGSPSDVPMANLVRARLEGGCPEIVQAARAPENERALDDEHVNALALECAFRLGDKEYAYVREEQYRRVRRVAAANLVQQAQEADNHGNLSLAKRIYIQAFRANPGNARAAAGFARALHREGKLDEAEQVLQRCYRAVEGLNSAQLVTQAAQELGVSVYGS